MNIPQGVAHRRSNLYGHRMGIVDEERAAATAELVAVLEKEKNIPAEKLAAIRRCRNADISISAIARICGVRWATVARWMGEKA
jgi:transposase-like protein